jgi:fructan beta-fructosidase
MLMKNIAYSTLLLFLVLNFSCTLKGSEVQDSIIKFNEPHRPQYHFTPAANWMNDPNGMVYLDGEYHLFYQYYPDSTVWGPMHWGHAISTDLVHWEHFPVAIEPDSLGYIFSGSAVIDHGNTSGLGTKENPALVAIYTYHDPIGEKEKRSDYQTQGIAYSTDKGRTWTKYAENPVMRNPGIKDFRDPKVSWIKGKDGSGKWVMSLAVLDRISFYSSSNLLDWTLESSFNLEWAAYGGVWECPDLFQLQAADGTQKWILFVSINPGGPNGGSATQYFVGDFDGKTFTTEDTQVKWLDYGSDNYAGVTWSNVPDQDGRKLFIGWMSNWDYAQVVPTHPWRSATTLPRSLELVKSGEDYQVASRPVSELQTLRKSTNEFSGESVNLEEELVELELTPTAGSDFEVEISNGKGEKVIFKKSGDSFIFDRTASGLVDFEPRFAKVHTAPLNSLEVKSLRIFVDRSSVEIFVNDGEMVMTELVFPTEAYSNLKLTGFENSGSRHYLKSIW